MPVHVWVKLPITEAHALYGENGLASLTSGMQFITHLNKDQKSRCIKMGDELRAMLYKMEQVCKQFPDVMPRFYDVSQFYSTVEGVRNVERIRLASMSFLEQIESTATAIEDDAMRMMLAYYHALKQAANSIPGLRAIYNEFREYYIHARGKSPEEDMKAFNGQPVPGDDAA